MYYSSTKYDSIMDWVFSFGGIITIALIILAIWLIYNYFQKKKDDGNGNNNMYQQPKYYPQNKKTIYDNQNNTEFGSESFWDDMPKADINKTNSQQGTNFYPTREEEPIPPNAIPPSPYFEEEPFEELKVEEKGNTKQVVEDDVLFDDVKQADIPIDEPILIDEKENK